MKFKTCEYISGQENCSDGSAPIPDDSYYQGDSSTFPISGSLILILLALAIAVFLIYLLAKYSYQVATRTGRSRVGFVWLSIFFPLFTWVLCLVLDSHEYRYSEAERDKYRLKPKNYSE